MATGARTAAREVSGAAGKRVSPLVAGAFSAVFVLYLMGALLFARLESVWSPDCGARLIQVHSILEHPPAWWVTYPAAALDPEHKNSPLYFFEYVYGGHTYIFYSFVYALLSAGLYHILGYFGLSLLPLLSGFVVIVLTYKIARLLNLRYPLAPALLTALATPVALYSIVFWDQIVLAAIALFALYLALCALRNQRQSLLLWFAVGAVLGAGVWLHEILLPFAPALIVGAWWARRNGSWLRASGLLIAGLLMFLVPLAFVNHMVYGNLAGPHLSNNRLGSASSIGQFLLDPAQWGAGALYTLFGWGDASPAFTWQLKEWLVNPVPQFQQEIQTSLVLGIPTLLFALLALFNLWRRFWYVTLLTVAGLFAGSVYVMSHDPWAHTLFLTSPILLIAFASRMSKKPESAPALSEEETENRLLRQFIAVVLTVFTLLNLIKPTLGGTEWGSRHLLAVVPGLTLLAWYTVESLLSRPSSVAVRKAKQLSNVQRFQEMVSRFALLSGFAILAIMSVLLQVHAILLVYGMHVRNRELADAIAATTDDVIVTEIWWAPLNGASAYNGKKILYAGDMEHAPEPLFARMQSAGIRSYTLIGGSPYSLSDFSRPYGYVPIENAAQPMPMNLYSNRFLLIDTEPKR